MAEELKTVVINGEEVQMDPIQYAAYQSKLGKLDQKATQWQQKARKSINPDVKGLDRRVLSTEAAIKRLSKSKYGENAPYAFQTKMEALQKRLGNLTEAKKLQTAGEVSEATEFNRELSSNPTGMVPKAEVEEMKPKKNQFVDPKTGEIKTRIKEPKPATVGTTSEAAVGGGLNTETYEASTATGAVKDELEGFTGVKGELSAGATGTAATVAPSPGALAEEEASVDPGRVQEVTSGTREVTPDEIGTAAGAGAVAPEAEATTVGPSEGAETIKGSVGANELATHTATEKTKGPDAGELNRTDDPNAAKGNVTKNMLAESAEVDKAAQANVDQIKDYQLSAAADPTGSAPKIAELSVDDGTLAEFTAGSIEAKDTVQGQLQALLKQFNDGTPSWAAGAIRGANAAMNARGLGRSSMAGAAIYQAAMESALPIAVEDAQAFRQMKLDNLNRAQQVSLANAAAAQGFKLAEFNAEQQMAIQKSINATNFDISKMGAMQAMMVANAQIRAGIQGKSMDNQTSVNLANAATYAANQKINLSNEQQVILQSMAQNFQGNLAEYDQEFQSSLAKANINAARAGLDATHQQQIALANAERYGTMKEANLDRAQMVTLAKSAENLQINMANLDAKTQTAIVNAQVKAALQGQVLSNEQQMAIFNAQQFTKANDLTFTAEQTAALHNSTLMQNFGLAELDAKNARVLQNAATLAAMDQTNATFEQQMAIQNAQNFLAMDLKNLDNAQQAEMFNKQAIVQGLFNDQSAKNIAKNFNVSQINDAQKYMKGLMAQVSMHNSTEANAMKRFNKDAINTLREAKVNRKMERAMFETQNQVAIEMANASWRRDIDTLNTAATNAANMEYMKGVLGMTNAAYEAMTQRERDVMSYAFQASENALERNLKMFLSDKEYDLVEKQMKDNEEAAKGNLLGQALKGIMGSFGFDF